MPKKIFSLVLAAAFAASLSTYAVAAPPDKAQGKSATAEKSKKPGKTCTGLDSGSQAYKDCIAKNAHDGQNPKKGKKTKPKPAA